jgi:RNA polymerase sigma factor (sigma-70 family)
MHAHNDNTPTPSSIAATRPAAFDAMLMQYRPGLSSLAYRLGFRGEEREDLVTDTIIHCLKNWQDYRGAAPWEYLRWQMLNICKSYRTQEQRKRMFVTRNDIPMTGTPATQEQSTDLSLIARRLNGRGGAILARVAVGETFTEVGKSMGISRQRAQQLEREARQRLVAGMGAERRAAA